MIKMIPFNTLNTSDTKKNAFDKTETETLSQDFTAVLSGFSAVQQAKNTHSETANLEEKAVEANQMPTEKDSDFCHPLDEKGFEIKTGTPIDINPNQQTNTDKYNTPIDINPNLPTGEDKYNTPIDINPNLPDKNETPQKITSDGRIFTQFDDKILYDKNSSGRNRPVPREPGDIRFSNEILQKTRLSGPRFVIDQENILDIPKNDLNQVNKEQTSILDLDNFSKETVEILSVKNSPVKPEVNASKEIVEIKTDNFETHDLTKIETTDSTKIKNLKYFYNFETNRVDEIKKEKLTEKLKVKNSDILSGSVEEKSGLNTENLISQNRQITAEPINFNPAEKPIPKPENPLSISNEFSGVDFEKFFKSVSNKQEVLEIAPDFLIEDSGIYEQIEPKIIELSKFVDKTEEKQLMKMRLNPAELGEVEIRLEKNGAGKINVHIQTENEAARHILSESLGQLRDSLQNSGLTIEKLDVSCDQNQTGNEQRENHSRQIETSRENALGNLDKEDEKRESTLNRLVNLRA